jgi:tetratricopeptide (TPR) repeat protein
MHKLPWGIVVVVAALVTACAGFTVAGQVQRGRQALLLNDPETALAYFQPAAEKEPNYIYTSANFREGVWTYLGRAQYAQGKYGDAQRSLERALSVYRDDAMAQLYLGLAMVRAGERGRGLKQMQMGLKGLYDWIEFLNRSNPYQAFWDPNAEIRKEIDKTLAQTSGERTESMDSIIASAEWIGRQMEEEIDKVRRDEQREFRRDLDRGGRSGFGFGIGF